MDPNHGRIGRINVLAYAIYESRGDAAFPVTRYDEG